MQAQLKKTSKIKETVTLCSFNEKLLNSSLTNPYKNEAQ